MTVPAPTHGRRPDGPSKRPDRTERPQRTDRLQRPERTERSDRPQRPGRPRRGGPDRSVGHSHRRSLERPVTRFALPADLAAAEPPEARGLARDGVRLLTATGDRIQHARFADLGQFLSPGDLLVVNTSATRAAAVDGENADLGTVVVHFSTIL